MKGNPAIGQIVRSLTLRDHVLFTAAMCSPKPFPYVESQEEEQHLQALVHELSESGLSPSEIASYVRGVTGHICLSVLRMPVDQRGASWFCKEALHRLCSGIQIPNNPPSLRRSQDTAEE